MSFLINPWDKRCLRMQDVSSFGHGDSLADIIGMDMSHTNDNTVLIMFTVSLVSTGVQWSLWSVSAWVPGTSLSENCYDCCFQFSSNFGCFQWFNKGSFQISCSFIISQYCIDNFKHTAIIDTNDNFIFEQIQVNQFMI